MGMTAAKSGESCLQVTADKRSSSAEQAAFVASRGMVCSAGSIGYVALVGNATTAASIAQRSKVAVSTW